MEFKIRESKGITTIEGIPLQLRNQFAIMVKSFLLKKGHDLNVSYQTGGSRVGTRIGKTAPRVWVKIESGDSFEISQMIEFFTEGFFAAIA